MCGSRSVSAPRASSPPAPDATHVTVWAEYGYSANLRLEDLLREGVLFATHHDGGAADLDPAMVVIFMAHHLSWRGGHFLVIGRIIEFDNLPLGQQHAGNPNLVAEAAKDLGITDDRARLAIANAALREGKKLGRWEVAAAVVAEATGPAGVAERTTSPCSANGPYSSTPTSSRMLPSQ